MQIHDLTPNEGATRDRNRVGRGTGSGSGKTCGRGTKGQKARSGKPVRLYHQGGNLPFFRRLPFKRGQGFTPPNRVRYIEVNLARLAELAANTEITPETLVEAGIIRSSSKPVKIMGEGEVSVPLTVRVHKVTSNAQAKIEAAGGKVETLAL